MRAPCFPQLTAQVGKRTGGLWGFLLNKPDFSRAMTEEVLSTNFRSHTRDSRSIIRATDYASAQHTPTNGDGQTISPTPGEQLMLAQRALNATRLNHRRVSTQHQPLHTIHTTVSKSRLSQTCTSRVRQQLRARLLAQPVFWPSSQERLQQQCQKS
ncbi:MAG TPA: hypothetical protein VGN95_17120 [Pyrinomonadaceae bacterium]|nr:hypothetical protein [Pyrinomonadaceae bacterium]